MAKLACYTCSNCGAVLYGGYCYDNEELWGMVELASSYFE